MLNPIATVKFFGLHALLVGAMALVGGVQVHEATPPLIRNAPPPTSTLTISSLGWSSAVTASSGLTLATASSTQRGGNVTFIAGHMTSVKPLASAPWGVDFRTARGKSVLRFERDGRVYLDGQLMDRDPRVVRALCAWFVALRIGVPSHGRYFTSQPGRGGLDVGGADRPDLDGHTYFRDRNGNTLLHLDENGRSDEANRYAAFLRWLDDAMPTAGDGGAGGTAAVGGAGGFGTTIHIGAGSAGGSSIGGGTNVN